MSLVIQKNLFDQGDLPLVKNVFHCRSVGCGLEWKMLSQKPTSQWLLGFLPTWQLHNLKTRYRCFNNPSMWPRCGFSFNIQNILPSCLTVIHGKYVHEIIWHNLLPSDLLSDSVLILITMLYYVVEGQWYCYGVWSYAFLCRSPKYYD